MRSLATAQERFKDQCIVDQDGDGEGEFGWLGELAGNQPVRGSGLQLNTSPFIASILGVRDARGVALKSGYCFALYLRDASGRWTREPVTTGTAVPPAVAAEADAQEARWICYAWPNTRGQAGNRAFVVLPNGDVYSTANNGPSQRYSGATRGPKPRAAFAPDGRTIAVSRKKLVAGDGGQWVPAGN